MAGVVRAYPYAGKPAALLATSTTADRTVYIESTTAIDADGILSVRATDEATSKETNATMRVIGAPTQEDGEPPPPANNLPSPM